MAQIIGRTRGNADLPAVPTEAASTVAELSPLNTAAPATDGESAVGPSHPESRKPGGPTGGGGHGNGGGNK